jgi:ADP-ribose pyrophosphatase YjhB (NUDIX family)
MWVFPGGRVDPADPDQRATAVRETAEETGVEVSPERLIRLTRWVTPPGLPSRFDARFFGAVAPAGTEARIASPEVAAVAWLGPAVALEAHARGELAMWQPTFVTLQQLADLEDESDIAAAFRPGDGADRAVIRPLGEGLRRVDQPWAAGIEGRVATGWVVGHREWVVVDPADPTGQTFDAIRQAAAAAGARLAGVAITDLRPEHHAGVEMFAAGLGLPVAGGIGSAVAPYPVTELDDGERLPFGDVLLVARRGVGAGPRRWPGAVSFESPGGLLGQ